MIIFLIFSMLNVASAIQMGFGRITNTIAVDNIPARGLGGGEWTTLGPSGQMPGAGVPLHVPFT